MKLHPFNECAADANQQVLKGHTVYQKWQCSYCDAHQHMEKVNHFFTQGICEECKKVTDILHSGCNYLLVMDLKGTADVLAELQRRIDSNPGSNDDSLSTNH